MRQFAALFLALVVLGGGGYWAYKTLFKGQDKTYASLSDIQKELATLADLNGGLRATLEENRKDIENQLTKGMKALNDKDYKTAIQYLENVAKTTPASTVYQNIAYAYEQIGKQDKAQEALTKAKAINPNLEVVKTAKELKGKTINLLAAENGGKIIVASSSDNKYWIDGSEEIGTYQESWTIFGFKEGAKATISQFRIFIPKSEYSNPTGAKILYNNESPTGDFTLIEEVKIFDGFMSESPFQTFSLPPTKIKYVKVQFSNTRHPDIAIKEIQLLGTLE